MYDPCRVEDFIEFLMESRLWQEAAERLAGMLNEDRLCSIKGKTKHELWLGLCDLLTNHATEVNGLNVDAIIRGGIEKFVDGVGCLWVSLADYYIRRKLLEKARDSFEEGMSAVVTLRDFCVIFDAYMQFEESMLAFKMENVGFSGEEEDQHQEELTEDGKDIRRDVEMPISEFEKVVSRGFWIHDDNDVDWRLARLENLMDRRPKLANSVLLRQNLHNVEQWHRRVKLYVGNPSRQIMTFSEAVRTVDPLKAVGKPHTLWIAFAKLFENHMDLNIARGIFDRAVEQPYKTVNELVSIWCEWVEMELRYKMFDKALALMQRATAVPAAGVKRVVATDSKDPCEPVQMELHRSLMLWTFYVDLEESLGTLESTCCVYDRILELKIATPQLIINYATLLEENKYFEDAFQIYERGVTIFKYPHVKDIWLTYLSKFVERYGMMKLERARELFERAVASAPAEFIKPIYLQYAKLEEDYGLAKRVMKVYGDATKAVPAKEKLSMYEIYIARAAEICGVPKMRIIYDEAFRAGLPDKDAKTICLKYAEFEEWLGEIDRAREIYRQASPFADPRTDPEIWNRWHEFEVQHGNEETFREMLRAKRSTLADYSVTQFVRPEYLNQREEAMNSGKAADGLKHARVAEQDMAALRRKLAPVVKEIMPNGCNMRVVRFVRASDEFEDVRKLLCGNPEDIELPDKSKFVDEDKVEIARKDIPAVVFGGLVEKRENFEQKGGGENGANSKRNNVSLGALERRLKRC